MLCHVQSLPFVEYELHKQLVNKLKIKGMNSLFRLKIQISVGLTQLVAIAVSRLPLFYCRCNPPTPPENLKVLTLPYLRGGQVVTPAQR